LFDVVIDQLDIQYPDVVNPDVKDDFLPFPPIPTQAEVEEWIVAHRRKELERRYLLT
jgi:hypothetical protein